MIDVHCCKQYGWPAIGADAARALHSTGGPVAKSTSCLGAREASQAEMMEEIQKVCDNFGHPFPECEQVRASVDLRHSGPGNRQGQ